MRVAPTARAALVRVIALLLLAALALPFAADAQRGRVPRLGVLLFGAPATDPNLAAFLDGLRELGHVEGRTIALEYRFAEGKPEATSPSRSRRSSGGSRRRPVRALGLPVVVDDVAGDRVA
jgi:hypothetical protein